MVALTIIAEHSQVMATLGGFAISVLLAVRLYKQDQKKKEKEHMTQHRETDLKLTEVEFSIQQINQSRERCRGYSEKAMQEVKAELHGLRKEMVESTGVLDGKVTRIMELLIERR